MGLQPSIAFRHAVRCYIVSTELNCDRDSSVALPGAKRGRRLSGWQRIGIILSCVWVLGAGFYQRNADIRAADEFSHLSFNICTEREHIRQQRDPNYSGNCVEDAVTDYQIWLEGSWGNVAFAAFVPIPVAWMLAYLVLAIARWVSAGFGIKRAP
jgi:hypothetical protein